MIQSCSNSTLRDRDDFFVFFVPSATLGLFWFTCGSLLFLLAILLHHQSHAAPLPVHFAVAFISSVRVRVGTVDVLVVVFAVLHAQIVLVVDVCLKRQKGADHLCQRDVDIDRNPFPLFFRHNQRQAACEAGRGRRDRVLLCYRTIRVVETNTTMPSNHSPAYLPRQPLSIVKRTV